MTTTPSDLPARPTPDPKPSGPPHDTPKTIFEHIADLRRCVLRALLAVILCTTFALPFQHLWLSILLYPARNTLARLTYLSPPEPFLVQFKIALIAGILLALPYVAWQAWLFLAPALYDLERRWILRLAGVSIILFWLGMLFAFFVAVPFALRFFISFETNMLQSAVTLRHYVGFVNTLLLAFGLAFQLPLVLLFLMKTGLVPRERLAHNRRIAFVVLLIISAILTPPDALSMLAMAAPLYLLFELSLWLERLFSPHSLTFTPTNTAHDH
ncbi:MAG: twin-arginine translocase subunit TatC [bacterium]|nr:twin-arginine translocase subunit TatC [bacterium]